MTMYLTSLLIDVGNNPDRPRPGRSWLRNLYHVHQRLCMAFPSAERRTNDPAFLQPHNPGDFTEAHVHVARAVDAGFLFRIDPLPRGRAAILVQSAIEPDWDYAFHNARYLLATPPQVKPFVANIAANQELRFRLVANPTKKIDTKSGPDGQRRNGRRVPVPADQLLDWLARRGESAGYRVQNDATVVQAGYVYVKKSPNDEGQRLCSARYDGLLTVVDPIAFQATLACGIGPAKAFGFGLLSVARTD